MPQTTGSPNQAKWSIRSAAVIGLRYGLGLVALGIALVLTQEFLQFHLPQPFTAFALCAIAITFWYGGIGPGILAALLAALIRVFFFESGVNNLSRIVYDLVFGVFAILMTQATRARNELEVKVAERTAALTQANQDLKLEIAERRSIEEKLRQSEAYLTEAQRLSHTGSWAWDVGTRELVHSSEEWRRIFPGIAPSWEHSSVGPREICRDHGTSDPDRNGL